MTDFKEGQRVKMDLHNGARPQYGTLTHIGKTYLFIDFGRTCGAEPVCPEYVMPLRRERWH